MPTPPHYEAVLVHRTPERDAPPTLTEVDEIVGASGLSWTETLNGPDQATVSFLPDRQSADVKRHLRNLRTEPAEIWIRRGTRIVAAGRIGALQVQGKTITMTLPGITAYLTAAYVEPGRTLNYKDTEQLAIAKGLVDYWQGLNYGHFGIDTSHMATPASGVTRNRTYDGSEGTHQIMQRITELGAVADGFDWRTDPHTRRIITGYPTIGQDLTQTVIVDYRSIQDAGATLAIPPGDFGTVAYGWSTSGQDHLTSKRASTSALHDYGRMAITRSYQDIADQATLDAYTEHDLAASEHPIFDPTPRVVPIGFDLDAFGPGDHITYQYDHGFGEFSQAARVAARTITVDDDGKERIAVKFL